jgi:CBS-domain-containing membrane protein
MTRALVAPAVGDIMNRAPTTVRPDPTIPDLVRLLQADQADTVAVIDAGGILRGIVTPLDLLRAFRPDQGLEMPGPEAFADRTVETIMRPGVITLEPSDPIPAAVDLLVETRFHALPVVHRQPQGPVLIGMVGQRDLLSTLLG